eukprot:140775-Rhodomonas_salina.1
MKHSLPSPDRAPAPQLAGIGVWLRKEAAGGYRVQRVTMRGRVGGTPEGGGVEVGDSVLEIDGASLDVHPASTESIGTLHVESRPRFGGFVGVEGLCREATEHLQSRV